MAAVVDADRLDPLGLDRRRGRRAVIAPPLRARMRADGLRRSRRGRTPRRASAAIARSARAAAGKREQLADLGRRGRCGRKASAKPGWSSQQRRRRDPLLLDDDRHRVAALGDLDRRREQVGERQLAEALATAPPSRHGARHGDRVPAAHRRRAARRRRACARKYSGVQAAGARPEALRPCSFLPSQRMQKASEPRPLLHGSTTVITAAAAIAASTALPPCCSMRSPAWAASGCEVETMLRAKTGRRVDG